MKNAREIEILFRRLRLYDRLERRAEGLVRTIQRVMKERYGPRITSVPKSSTCASRSEDSARKSSSFKGQGFPPRRLNSSLEGCTPKSTTFVLNGTGSRRRRAVQRKGACLAAGVGDARTIEMVRRRGGQLALDRRACRITSTRYARGPGSARVPLIADCLSSIEATRLSVRADSSTSSARASFPLNSQRSRNSGCAARLLNSDLSRRC